MECHSPTRSRAAKSDARASWDTGQRQSQRLRRTAKLATRRRKGPPWQDRTGVVLPQQWLTRRPPQDAHPNRKKKQKRQRQEHGPQQRIPPNVLTSPPRPTQWRPGDPVEPSNSGGRERSSFDRRAVNTIPLKRGVRNLPLISLPIQQQEDPRTDRAESVAKHEPENREKHGTQHNQKGKEREIDKANPAGPQGAPWPMASVVKPPGRSRTTVTVLNQPGTKPAVDHDPGRGTSAPVVRPHRRARKGHTKRATLQGTGESRTRPRRVPRQPSCARP